MMTNVLFDTLFGKHAGQATPFLISPDGSVLTHDAFLGMAAQFAHAITGAGPRYRPSPWPYGARLGITPTHGSYGQSWAI